MAKNQYCSPLLIDADICHVLERVAFSDRGYSEDWLQNLLFEQPTLIPINDIEPLFSPLIPIAREMQTNVGPVDVVYISPTGYLTLVETKLWRNPESRRHAVAQIMDYSAAIAKWTYEDLQAAVKKAGGSANLVEAVASNVEDFEEARFIDAVSDNLFRGRILLLLVGDGIQAGVEQLADILARSPHLGISLGLVELAIYRFGEPQKTLVLPRLVARTREVVRAVVDIRVTDGKAQVEVTLPEDSTLPNARGPRRRLTEEVLVEQIGTTIGPVAISKFESFLKRCEELGIQPKGRDRSLSLFWQEPNTERQFTFGSIIIDERVRFEFVMHYYRKAGLDPQIGFDYVHEVSKLVLGAVVKDNFTKPVDFKYVDIFVSGKCVTLTQLLDRSEDWLSIIEGFMKRTEEAAEKLDG